MLEWSILAQSLGYGAPNPREWCGDIAGTLVNSVTIEPAWTRVAVSDGVKVRVAAKNADGVMIPDPPELAVVWTTGNSSVAAVYPTGVSTAEVVGRSPGATSLEASVSQCTHTYTAAATVSVFRLAYGGPAILEGVSSSGECVWGVEFETDLVVWGQSTDIAVAGFSGTWTWGPPTDRNPDNDITCGHKGAEQIQYSIGPLAINWPVVSGAGMTGPAWSFQFNATANGRLVGTVKFVGDDPNLPDDSTVISGEFSLPPRSIP
jgi:hypothetical protein